MTIQKKRPVLLKFRYAEDVTICIEKAYKLARTQISIDRDYPSEIRQARKRLWPEVKRLRAREGKKSVKLVFPAAIKVNGTIVKDEFPGWDSINKSDLNLLNDQNTPRAPLIMHESRAQSASMTAGVLTQSSFTWPNIGNQVQATSVVSHACQTDEQTFGAQDSSQNQSAQVQEVATTPQSQRECAKTNQR